MGLGPIPDPRRTIPPIDVSAEDLQGAIFEELAQDLPAEEVQASRLTMNEFVRGIPENAVGKDGLPVRDTWIRQFQAWASGNFEVADFNDTDQFSRFQREVFGFGADGGGGGRTQFESERALDEARAQLAQEQALTEAFVRENQRQQAANAAQERVKDKLDLLQLHDQLGDSRRQAAVQALIAAAPFLTSPGQQFTPGLEPFGIAEQLGARVGFDAPNQMLPTATLPLNELANPQLAAPPSLIAEQLNPGLTAPGQPQIPF